MAPWQPPPIDFWTVPRCWPDECVAILGGGASLMQEDVDHLRGKCRVIAINRAGLPRPRDHSGKWVCATWADWLWACDVDRFWEWHPEAIEFAGTKIVLRSIAPSREQWRQLAALASKGVKVLKHSGHKHPIAMGVHEGISPDPGVVHGNNALFQIMSVIAHTGARTILLLGCDMRSPHWHGGYRSMGEPNYETSVIPNFGTLVKPLAKARMAVFNCSQRSHLPYWERVNVRDVI